jgi:hypothetical protein
MRCGTLPGGDRMPVVYIASSVPSAAEGRAQWTLQLTYGAGVEKIAENVSAMKRAIAECRITLQVWTAQRVLSDLPRGCL